MSTHKPTRRPEGVVPTEIVTSPNHTPPQGGVPDHVGVPRPGRPTLSRNNILAGGLNLDDSQPNVKRSFDSILSEMNQPDAEQNDQPNNLDELVQSAVTEAVPLTPNEPVESCLPQNGNICPMSSPNETVKPEPTTTQKAARKGFFSDVWSGMRDGTRSTMDRAKKQMNGTASATRSRLDNILARARVYRDRISESDAVKKFVAGTEELAVQAGVIAAKIGIWTVEVLATGWVAVSSGAWRITVMGADALVWLGSYGAAAVVEAALSGKELLMSIKDWATRSGKTAKQEQLEKELGVEEHTGVVFV